MTYYCEHCKEATDFKQVDSYEIEYTSSYLRSPVQETITEYACRCCDNRITAPHSHLPSDARRIS